MLEKFLAQLGKTTGQTLTPLEFKKILQEALELKEAPETKKNPELDNKKPVSKNEK